MEFKNGLIISPNDCTYTLILNDGTDTIYTYVPNNSNIPVVYYIVNVITEFKFENI